MPVSVNGRPPGSQLPSTGVDWLSPPDLVRALGPFDLDPCASVRQPWRTAKTQWTVYEDGTARDWHRSAFVWLNPPYGKELYAWLARLADHGNGIALLYARTDTVGFREHVWRRSSAVFFLEGRLWFHRPVTGELAPQNCGGPMLLACYGETAVKRAERLTKAGSPYPGHLVRVKSVSEDASLPRVVTGRGKGK